MKPTGTLVGPIIETAGGPPASRRAIRLTIYALLAIGDAAALGIAFLVAGAIRTGSPLAPAALVGLVVMTPIFFGVVVQRKPYSSRFFINWRRSARDAITALVTSAITAVAVAWVLSAHLHAALAVSPAIVGIAGGIAAVVLFGGRWLLHRIGRLVLGGEPVATLLIVDEVELPPMIGVPRIDAVRAALSPQRQDPAALALLSAAVGSAERVVVACPPERREDWAALLKGANVRGEIVTPELDRLGTIRSSSIAGMSTAVTSLGPLDTANRAIKRGFDLAVAGAALALLWPLMAAVAIAIRVEGPGPILFRQPRMGRGNALFEVLKFRSMRTDACDVAGDRSTARGDARVTRVGRIIRATSIDELPQLLNVLRGDMSIVGPRPHALGSLAGDKLFWEVDERYWDRHAMKPGITGLAQVHGHRGATAVPGDLTDRLRSDIAYMRGWSIWRDLRILVATVRVVCHRNAF